MQAFNLGEQYGVIDGGAVSIVTYQRFDVVEQGFRAVVLLAFTDEVVAVNVNDGAEADDGLACVALLLSDADREDEPLFLVALQQLRIHSRGFCGGADAA